MSTEQELERIVTLLAGQIGVRSHADPARLELAADLISREFLSLGYAVSTQSFTFQGRTYQNVIAELRGMRLPEKILVTGAHYDTVGATPGADDNASGVAVLLGIARSLAGKRLSKTLRFVAFSLEEPPAYRTSNMGSYHYARSLKESGADVEGMICLEMVGYFSDLPGSQSYPLPLPKRTYPSQGNFIALVGNIRSRRFTEAIAAAMRKATDLPLVTLNAPSIVAGIDFSDHWSFNEFHFNAFMVTDTAFYRNPHYHASTDTPETLDYVRMAKVVHALAGAIGQWAGVP